MNDVIENGNLTKAEASDRARRLIEEGKQDAVEGFMKIGAGFCLVADFRLHKLEGLTFAQYIAQCGMSWAKAHQAMAVYQRFGHLDVKGVLHTRLIELTDKRLDWDDEQKKEAIEQARVLGPRDFERFVAQKKGKEIPEVCQHEKTVTICERCHQKV